MLLVIPIIDTLSYVRFHQLYHEKMCFLELEIKCVPIFNDFILYIFRLIHDLFSVWRRGGGFQDTTYINFLGVILWMNYYDKYAKTYKIGIFNSTTCKCVHSEFWLRKKRITYAYELLYIIRCINSKDSMSMKIVSRAKLISRWIIHYSLFFLIRSEQL